MNDTRRDGLRKQVADAVHVIHEALVNSAPEWIADRDEHDLFDMAVAVKSALAAVPTVQAAAGNDLDADMTLAYMKGWQDGQDAIRKSVDAAVAKAKGASDDV